MHRKSAVIIPVRILDCWFGFILVFDTFEWLDPEEHQ